MAFCWHIMKVVDLTAFLPPCGGQGTELAHEPTAEHDTCMLCMLCYEFGLMAIFLLHKRTTHSAAVDIFLLVHGAF